MTAPIQAVHILDQTQHYQVSDITITDYNGFSDAVEGMIEAVNLVVADELPFTMWVNEEFMYVIDQLRINPVAMTLASVCGRFDLFMQGIWGNVLITGPADHEGETLSIPQPVREEIHRVYTALDIDMGEWKS